MSESVNSGWKEYKLREVGVIVTGKTPSSKNPDDFGNDIPFVTPTDYSNYHKEVSFADRFLSSIGANKLKSKILPPKSVMVTCIGSDMGKVAINTIPLITNQQINSIISDIKMVDPNFLYYKLVESYDVLRSYGLAGTAVPIVNKTDFEGIEILLPPLPEQLAIAGVLSSLDDKIDLLHRQNKTLEGMAEALFRKWFIEEADESWQKGRLGDYLKTELGGTPSTSKPEYWNGDIPWINSGEVNKFRIFQATKYITVLGLKKSNAKLLPKGTTVIAITGATLGQVSLLEIDACSNQSVVGIIPNENFPKEFVFLWIKHKIEDLIANQTGGAQQHINKNDVDESPIIIPPKKLLALRIPFIISYFEKISDNIAQICTLSRLREKLLPKLMSGEVRVKL